MTTKNILSVLDKQHLNHILIINNETALLREHDGKQFNVFAVVDVTQVTKTNKFKCIYNNGVKSIYRKK